MVILVRKYPFFKIDRSKGEKDSVFFSCMIEMFFVTSQHDKT